MTKRIVSFLLISLLLTGCFRTEKPSDVTFYYPKVKFDYNSDDGIIGQEIRSSGGIFSTARLLNLYLKGPHSEALRNPFPENVSVISVYTMDGTVYVTLSDSLAALSGAQLILACACIGRTAMELSDKQNAQIQCDTLLLDGKQFITINESTIFYSDTFHQSEQEVP